MRHTIFLLVPAAIAAILSGCGGKPAAESGEEALAQGDYKAAAKFFRAAVKGNPSSVPLFYNLGTAQALAGDTAGAISSFREVLRFTPGDLDAFEVLAVELRKAGSAENLAESHELLDFVVGFRQTASEKARALNSLALTEKALRRNDLAVARLVAALTADPGYATACYNMADLCAKTLNLPVPAKKAIDAFLASAPEDAALAAKAVALRDSVAASIPVPYSHATGEEAKGFVRSGAEAYAKKDYAKAEQMFAKAAEADPLAFEARFNRANALLSANRLSEAATSFAEAAAIDPARFDAAFWQARLAYATGDYGKAIELLTGRVIPSWPDEPQSYLFASYAYAQQQRYYEAEVFGELYVAKAAKADPKAKTADFKAWLDKLPKTKFKP
jgi:tetratricopeptide (TPR) repeat protein